MAETLRGGRYVIVGVLGEGSQGRTFDAVDKEVGQAVAIKRFDVRGARAWKDVDLAERETRVLQSLSHPSVPRYVDHFEEDGVLYLVTEKVEGASLADLRRRGVPLREHEAMRLLEDAAGVLAYLQGRSPPVVHRDIKPANVIRRPDGSHAFVDFGAVRDNLRPGGSTVVGTFGYMAPEQFQGRALPGSDVYGVGATVLSLLAGVEPEALPHKGLAIDVRASLAGTGASERITRILERMLQPDPDVRASAIAPLLSREGSRRPSRPSWSDPHQVEATGRDLRREARRVRRAARDQARALRRGHDPYRGQGVAWPLEVLFTLAFSVGLVVVSVVTQVAVPLFLRVLSIFIARRALLGAAESVQEAGGAAVRSMSQSRRWMRGEVPMPPSPPAGAPPVRVGSANPGIRVAPLHEEGDDDAEGERDDEPAARRKR